ncbi:CHC2 zinc finger domain-containing protein [Gemmatimonadota bacterium]
MRYARAVRRATTGIEIQLPPPISRQLRHRFNEPLPVESARQVPILSVLERIGIGHVRKVGREYVALCPFHDDSRPSLRIDAERGLWYCDPCGTGGDGIDLWQRIRRIPFRRVIEELSEAL